MYSPATLCSPFKPFPMKRILIFLAIASWTQARAQTLQPSVLNASGISGNAGGVHFEFNLGETFIHTLSGGGLTATLGLLQPQAPASNAPLPVTGLQLTARRLDAAHVRLDWKTLQEINNRGFHIERKTGNELAFVPVGFLATAAPAGTSATPLGYQYVDGNVFGGKTWYRLKQEDHDGRSAYSNIAIVNGLVSATLTAWPVPAPRDFQVRYSGEKTEQLLLFNATGKLLRRLFLSPNETVGIAGLPSGTYFLRLEGHPDLVQRVVVQ